jgi:hypothetical protein
MQKGRKASGKYKKVNEVQFPQIKLVHQTKSFSLTKVSYSDENEVQRGL